MTGGNVCMRAPVPAAGGRRLQSAAGPDQLPLTGPLLRAHCLHLLLPGSALLQPNATLSNQEDTSIQAQL